MRSRRSTASALTRWRSVRALASAHASVVVAPILAGSGDRVDDGPVSARRGSTRRTSSTIITRATRTWNGLELLQDGCSRAFRRSCCRRWPNVNTIRTRPTARALTPSTSETLAAPLLQVIASRSGRTARPPPRPVRSSRSRRRSAAGRPKRRPARKTGPEGRGTAHSRPRRSGPVAQSARPSATYSPDRRGRRVASSYVLYATPTRRLLGLRGAPAVGRRSPARSGLEEDLDRAVLLVLEVRVGVRRVLEG